MKELLQHTHTIFDKIKLKSLSEFLKCCNWAENQYNYRNG